MTGPQRALRSLFQRTPRVLTSAFLKLFLVIPLTEGGICTAVLLEEMRDRVLKLLRGISFTDSVHGRRAEALSAVPRAFFCENAINWITSEKPLDTLLVRSKHGDEMRINLRE